MRTSLIAALALLLVAPAGAFCPQLDPRTGQFDINTAGEPRSFPVDYEFLHSFLVVTGRVVSVRNDLFDPKDPNSILDSNYRVIVQETFKGPVLHEFTYRNENDSSRFYTDVGATYLLFANSDGKITYIDSCGWSDKLAVAAATLEKVKALAAAKPH